ncbi:MAG: ATP-binding protein [Planctomycetota bacterium]
MVGARELHAVAGGGFVERSDFRAPDGEGLRGDGQAVLWPTVLRMRDVAVIGQLGVMGMALWLGIGFDVWAVAAVIGVTLASNVALRLARRWRPAWVSPWMPAVVLFDLSAFSVLMFLTGGSNNPLCTIYMVHVAMGVVLLPLTWAAALTVITASAYGLMFRWRRPIDVPAEWAGSEVVAAWLALAVAAVLIAYFIWLVKSALIEREQKLARLQRVEVDNARLASLTTLAAGAAHELGSPLGTIAMASREIERATGVDAGDAPPVSNGMPEEVAEDARLIRAEVDRCRDILDRLRSEEMAAWLTQEPEEIDPREVERGLRAALGRDADRLEVTIEPGLDRVRLMTQAVVQVLLILVRNAMDASASDQSVRLSISRRGELTQILVVDEGEGMPDSVLSRVFEAFYTTKPAGRGMGIGLFLAKLMVDGMGGNLRFRSEVGRGTTAELSIGHGDFPA